MLYYIRIVFCCKCRICDIIGFNTTAFQSKRPMLLMTKRLSNWSKQSNGPCLSLNLVLNSSIAFRNCKPRFDVINDKFDEIVKLSFDF